MNQAMDLMDRTALLDFPSEGELILSSHYTIRVTAPGAKAVEVSIDAGPWTACSGDSRQWSYDWTGYAAGNHVICTRVTRHDGSRDVLRPRVLRVAFASHGADKAKDKGVGDIEMALESLKEREVEWVQLWFTGLGAKPWRVSLPVEHLNETSFTAGVTLDGPSTSLAFPSYINLVPDPAAIFMDPMATIPTAAIMCDLIEPHGVAPSAIGVRRMLRNACRDLEQIQTGLHATMGAEGEYFLLEADGKPSPEEDVWTFNCDLARTLKQAGIKAEGFRYGPAKGQGRVQMRWADPVKTADHLVLYRWFARCLARRRGKMVSFEQQSPSGEGAASMPVHHTLWLGKENAFHDPKGWQYTSDMCRHYMGGMIRHARAASAFYGTANSFPMRAGSRGAVIKPYLSATNADALCRIPERMLYPAGRRVKTRAGNAGANPYLALGAMLLAGMDGLRHKTAPDMEPKCGMPESLEEALCSLGQDRDFLKAGGFTDAFVDAWIANRRRAPEDYVASA